VNAEMAVTLRTADPEPARGFVNPFFDNALDPAVRGFLHSPQSPNDHTLILTHGAGGNCNAPLLVALADIFSERGYTVLRCDLPYRQAKPFGPPFPGQAEHDRAGLRNAVEALRNHLTFSQVSAQRRGANLGHRANPSTGSGRVLGHRAVSNESSGKIFLGGHSYGGRQSTILCADEPDLVCGLLLLSYPLHPPRKPDQLRTAHLPNLRTPSLFVHGTRDPFGSFEEMEKALALIPAKHELLEVEGAGHDLGFKGKQQAPDLPGKVFDRFDSLFRV
jgi:uncharacterized protein